MENIIEINNLYKSYNDVHAVNNLSFRVKKGELFAFLGVNGAGKISAEGTPLELKNNYTGDYITIYGVSEEEVRKLNHKYEKIRDAYRVSVANTEEARDLIVNNQELFKDFEITKGKMDDVFLSVTGKKLVGGN